MLCHLIFSYLGPSAGGRGLNSRVLTPKFSNFNQNRRYCAPKWAFLTKIVEDVREDF